MRSALRFNAPLMLICAAPLLASAAVAAEPTEAVTLGSAVPLDVPLLLTATTIRPGRDGAELRFSARYRIEFSVAGRGLAVQQTLLSHDNDAPGAAGRSFAALLDPLVGRRVDMLIGDDGAIMMSDAEALWAAVALGDAGGGSAAGAAQKAAGLFAAMPEAARHDLLTADLAELIRFRGAVLPRTPLPGGTWAAAVEDGRAMLRAVDRADGTSTAKEWQVDVASGLVMEQQERVVSDARADPDGTGARFISQRMRTLTPLAAQ